MAKSIGRVPDEVCLCPRCGTVVLRVHFPDGSVLVWEPDFVQRRLIRSYFGPGLLGRAVWGESLYGAAHACAGGGVRRG